MNEVGVFKRVSAKKAQQTKILRIPQKSDIVPSVLLFLVSRGTFLGMSPFCTAMFAAVYEKKIAYVGVLAAALGILSTGGGGAVLKYIFSMILFWLYTRIREDYKSMNIISSAVCGGCVLLSGLASYTYTNAALYDFFLLVCESITAAFMYIAFSSCANVVGASRKKLSQEEIICFCVSTGAVIMGFSGVVLPFGTEVVKLLSAYAVMLISQNTALAAAGTGSLATGLICGVNTRNISSLMGLYGFCAIGSNMLKGFGKYGVMLGFLASSAIVMLCEGTSLSLPINASEIIGAVFMFMITPPSVHARVGDFFAKGTQSAGENAGKRIKDCLVDKLNRCGAAFSALSESFGEMSKKRLNVEDVTVIFDDTAERVCKSCGMSAHCWQRSFNDTYRDMYTMLSLIEQNGRLNVCDMPKDFSNRCVRAEKLINCFSHMYELYKQRRMYSGETAENRNLLAKQYGDISEIMTSLAAETESGFEFMENTEKQLACELDKAGISADNICALGVGRGIAVTMDIYGSYSPESVCRICSEVIGMPVHTEYTVGTDRLTFVTGSGVSTEVGFSQICKTGEEDNGDSFADFATNEGKLAVAISDGMGSGKRAMLHSRMTIGLLEKFISAGFDKSVGIDIINSSLALRSERECYSTVDLLIVDKQTCEAEFVKAGAPESYILSDGEVETVFSSSLPAGMVANAEAEVNRRMLKRGDVIVMMSDGVSDAGKSLVRGEWIKKQMLSEFSTAQELAERIIDGAVKRSGTGIQDDMSVAVVVLK